MPLSAALSPSTPFTAPVALFFSDVHLHSDAPDTARVFFDFLQSHARQVQELYLLGDLFEYWAGDDDLSSPFNARVVTALRALSDAGVAVFWMAGNRDFLIGKQFAIAAGLTIMPDPSVVTIAGVTVLLSHGDAACTDDTDYQRFRCQVRSEKWQHDFLATPLAQRLALIAKMRQGSRDAQRHKGETIMDVNAAAIAALYANSGTRLMIHGHTHRPAIHYSEREGICYTRYVLTDWDCEGHALRGGGLVIDATGVITALTLTSDTAI